MKISTGDPYSTHIQILTKYLLKTPNNSTVIETGCGLYSSPIISEFAYKNNLKHIIYYQNLEWKEYIEKFVYKEHTQFIHVKDWNLFSPVKSFLFFHDSEELIVNRFKRINEIVKNTKYLILHDSNTYKVRHNNNNIFDSFDIIEEYKLREPHSIAIKGDL